MQWSVKTQSLGLISHCAKALAWSGPTFQGKTELCKTEAVLMRYFARMCLIFYSLNTFRWPISGVLFKLEGFRGQGRSVQVRFWLACDARVTMRQISVAGERKNADLRRY